MPPHSCSFCGQIGHNIRYCDSQMISIVYDCILTIYNHVLALQHDIETSRNIFKSTISTRFNCREIKAVAVRHRLCNSNSTKDVIIQELWNLLSRDQLFDAIPEYAQDLAVSWDIVRLPQPYDNYDTDSETESETESDTDSNDFIPLNLEPTFEAVAAERKKYYLSAILMCQESDEELEQTADCCPICYESVPIKNIVRLNCEHEFCYTCILAVCEKNKKRTNPCCALCREPMTTIVAKDDDVLNAVNEICY